MTIKFTTIIKYCVFLFFIIAVSLTKLLTNTPFDNIRTLSIILMIIMGIAIFFYLLSDKDKYYRYVNVLMIYSVLFFLIEWMYTNSKYHVGFNDFFFSNERFLFMCFAGAILLLLRKSVLNLEQLFAIISVFMLISYGIRIIISVYYGMTGTVIFNSIATENAMEGWIRNGVLRVNQPAFYMLIIPIDLWLVFYGSKKSFRYLGIITFLTVLFFVTSILQSRAAMINTIIISVLFFVLRKQTSLSKLLAIFLIFVMIMMLYINGNIDSLLNSFSVANSSTGYSSEFRLICLDYYYSWWQENPFWGIGGLSEEQLVLNLPKGHIADIGYLANVFRFGFFAIILFVLIFARWVYIAWMTHRYKSKYFVLSICILISYLMYMINIDCFYGTAKYAVPVSIAVMEWICYEVKQQIKMESPLEKRETL